MKRSEVNQAIRDAKSAFAEAGWSLPPFAHLAPEAWHTDRRERSEVLAKGLGWDVTDFGIGDFESIGLTMFTLRNGSLPALKAGAGKVYAEKLMLIGVKQVTPWHYHLVKHEDIINRSGGTLVIQFASNAVDDSLGDGSDSLGDDPVALGDDPVAIVCDDVERLVEPYEHVRLEPGQSVSIPPVTYHTFWAEESSVVAGEVSSVNDDNVDNVFLEELGRFPALEEDEDPLHALIGDYPKT